MLKGKKIQSILATIVVMGSLTGCSKGDETKVEGNGSNSNQQQNIETDKFDIYEEVINSEYRGSDIDSAFRNPSSFKGKKFTFSGTVLDSQTSDDGIQTVTVELDTEDMFIYGEMYEDGTIVKLEYDVESFDGERLVKDDRLAVCAEFNDIKNDSKHGDIAEFNVLATTNIIDYLSSLALTDYFKSVGVDIKDMGLEVEEFSDYKEFEKVVGKETAGIYGYDPSLVSVFSTKSGVYWLGSYGEVETGDYGIELYSGEKDDNGEIGFEYKQDAYFDSFKF